MCRLVECFNLFFQFCKELKGLGVAEKVKLAGIK